MWSLVIKYMYFTEDILRPSSATRGGQCSLCLSSYATGNVWNMVPLNLWDPVRPVLWTFLNSTLGTVGSLKWQLNSEMIRQTRIPSGIWSRLYGSFPSPLNTCRASSQQYQGHLTPTMGGRSTPTFDTVKHNSLCLGRSWRHQHTVSGPCYFRHRTLMRPSVTPQFIPSYTAFFCATN